MRASGWLRAHNAPRAAAPASVMTFRLPWHIAPDRVQPFASDVSAGWNRFAMCAVDSGPLMICGRARETPLSCEYERKIRLGQPANWLRAYSNAAC
jgi:hypothetical protein